MVSCACAATHKKTVIYGVPRGSALRPFQFLPYVNDLPTFTNTQVSLSLLTTSRFRVNFNSDAALVESDLTVTLTVSLPQWPRLVVFNQIKCKNVYAS